MPVRLPIRDAVEVARRLFSGYAPGDAVPSQGQFFEAIQEFERIEFDVPLATDADGFLFQLGSVSWLSAPTFVLGVTRQLEVVDAKGEHESYVQIAMEFHCALDADLQTLGHRSRWWFRGAGSTFSEWLKVISRDPVWQVVAMKSARDFSVTLEEV